MSDPTFDFAAKGADLLRLTASVGRATQGQWVGAALVALETTISFTQAGANAFAALCLSGNLSAEQRVAVQGLAGRFREALGTLATHFQTAGTVPTLAPLGAYNPNNPNAARLAPAMDDAIAALVSVNSTAQSALDLLRRDPLVLSTLPATSLLSAMAAAVSGVEVRSL